MPERTNPDTCEHRLAQPIVFNDDEHDHLIVCVSCDSTLDQEYCAEYKWIYDIDYNVWRRLTKAEVLVERRLAAEGFRRSLEPAPYFTKRQVEWPPYGFDPGSFRTPPEICGHRFIIPTEPGELDLARCISCDATIGIEFREDKHYEYDADHKVWGYVGPCDC